MTEKRAKGIFRAYSGSHYEMERAGVLREYESFNLSKEEESQWACERRSELLLEFERQLFIGPVFNELVHVIKSGSDLSGFGKLLKLADETIRKLDSFTLIRLAEEIYDLGCSLQKMEKGRTQTQNEFINTTHLLLDTAKKQKFWVADYYRQQPYLNAQLEEELVKSRALRLQEKLEKHLDPLKADENF